MTLTPYLLFDGNCRQAMEFYNSCFGGQLTSTTTPDGRILNAHLESDTADISASDWLRADRTAVRGNTVCLYLNGGNFEDLNNTFQKLSAGAEVTDPLQQQFFGMYGALNDKFGVRWMFRTDIQQ